MIARFERWKTNERQRWLDKQARTQELRRDQPTPSPAGLAVAVAAGILVGGWLLYALITSGF